MENIQTYLGRRLRCKDSSHTCFTPNLFPLLQVAFNSIFSDLGVHVRLEENAIIFNYEGVQVFIEICGQQGEEQFIDILIHSHVDLDSTLEWMDENVLAKVKEICGEPRGVQGVELVYEVIRPTCVEQALSSEERMQAVSIEILKGTVKKFLERKGYQISGKDIIQNTRYTWQPTADWDHVTELLGERESMQVIKSYIDDLNADAEDALGMNMDEPYCRSSMREKQAATQEFEAGAMGEVENPRVTETHMHGMSAVPEATVGIAAGTLGNHVEQEWDCSDNSRRNVFSSTHLEEREVIQSQVLLEVHKDLENKIEKLGDRVENKIEKLGDTVENKIEKLGDRVENKIENVGDRIEETIERLGDRLEKRIDSGIANLRDDIQKRLGELFTFIEEGEAGKLPRMYVRIRDDGQMLHKAAVAMTPALHTMRLGLLCERKSRPHFVDGQKGLRVTTLDNGLLKNALPYVNAFLKVAYLAVKVGAHVAAGVGNIVPDFTHVLALIADSDGVPCFPTVSAEPMEPSTSSSRVNYQKGQRWLYDVLSRHNCLSNARIHEVFGLSRVRYKKSRAMAWLCDAHSCEGEPCPL